jgi:hypothetical protein
MELIKKISTFVIVGAIGVVIGRFFVQPKTKVVEKEVVIYREKKEEKKNSKVTTRTREEKKPDGTVVTDTTKTEETKTETKTDTKIAKEKTKSTKSGSGVLIGAMIMDDLNDLRSKDHFGVMVAVPLAPRAYIFGTADMQQRIGIGLALEF